MSLNLILIPYKPDYKGVMITSVKVLPQSLQRYHWRSIVFIPTCTQYFELHYQNGNEAIPNTRIHTFFYIMERLFGFLKYQQSYLTEPYKKIRYLY